MEIVGAEIIAMEKAALKRWGRGDPDGFLEICAPDVVYFDPYVSYTGSQASRWNCTEAYRREPDGRWRIVQTHWSYTNVFMVHQ